jgi:transposase-like protein
MEAMALGGVPRVEETEVTEKAKRRSFTAEYKKSILEKIDRAVASGEVGAVGALLRREGLYSSHLTEWRQARERGELAGLTPKRRGPAKMVADERDQRIAQLERELARKDARLKTAELIIETQKKVSAILGIQLPEPPEESG